MYQFSYADILADDADDARARERQALDQAVALLQHAADDRAAAPSRKRKALDFTNQLWAFFIKDLAHPGNAMPDELRANLMSIGLGVMKECNRILLGDSRDFAAVAEICGIIRDGLQLRRRPMHITLRANEKIFINGAVLKVDRKTSIELMNDAVFLLEAHVMLERDATTPLRQLYYIVQLMLIEARERRENRTMFTSHCAAMAGHL